MHSSLSPTFFSPANATLRSGLQPALDWLLKHQDDPEPTAAELEAEANNTKLDEDEEGAPGGLAEAKVRERGALQGSDIRKTLICFPLPSRRA